jgi:hypothetical protein
MAKIKPCLETFFVLFSMVFAVTTIYFLLKNGGCSKCLYKEYAGLFTFLVSVPGHFLNSVL